MAEQIINFSLTLSRLCVTRFTINMVGAVCELTICVKAYIITFYQLYTVGGGWGLRTDWIGKRFHTRIETGSDKVNLPTLFNTGNGN
jgi:hypothetical protein